MECWGLLGMLAFFHGITLSCRSCSRSNMLITVVITIVYINIYSIIAELCMIEITYHNSVFKICAFAKILLEE